jgi:hypothetical protein
MHLIRDKRAEGLLAYAKDLEEHAATVADAQIRNRWLDIAASYRAIAAHPSEYLQNPLPTFSATPNPEAAD